MNSPLLFIAADALPRRRYLILVAIVVIVYWLPAELITEGLMLIVVFLNLSLLSSLS